MIITFDENIFKILEQVYNKYRYFQIENEFDKMFI